MYRFSLLAAVALSGATFATLAPAAKPEVRIEEAHLVALEPISVPIVDGDQVRGKLNLKLALNATTDVGAAELTETLPAVRTAAVGATSEYARLYASPFKAVDSVRLASDLKQAIAREHPQVSEVLVVEISARR